MTITKIFLILTIFSLPALAQEHCHRLEGVRLPHCTPQAKPLECGPPKPCPPGRAFKACSTMMITSSRGGTCDSWGQPECHVEGDKTVCGSAPCVHYTDVYCDSYPTGCGIDEISVPSTGTYDCSYNECQSPPPPAGYVDCGSVPTCQGNQTCPP